MSVNALNSPISAARPDGNITAEETKILTSSEALGAFTDKDEFESSRHFAADVKPDNKLTTVTPDRVKEANDKNRARLVRKGVKIGAGIGSGLGVVLLPFVWPFIFVAIPVAIGVGALAGYIHSRRKPITESQLEENSRLALAADVKPDTKLTTVTPDLVKEVNDKNKARLVHKGVKIGAGIGSVLGVALVFFSPPLILVAIPVAALSIGVGALAGYIHSRRKPITESQIAQDSPLALAAAQFKKNPLVQRGVKIGGIIGGVIGVPVGGFIALMGATAFATSFGSAVLVFGAYFGCIAGAAVCLLIGLGALGGYIHSKVKGRD